MSSSVSSLLPTQSVSNDIANVASSVQSLVSNIAKASGHKKSKTEITSLLNDIEEFANSDHFSNCEALRREDGSLRIFITGKDWDQGTVVAQLSDASSEDEIVISASRKYDPGNNPFVLIEVKRFLNIEDDLYEENDDIKDQQNRPTQTDVSEKHTITINSAGKVKTSFAADRKFEVLNGIDALKSTTRRLLELEMYKERGVLENPEDAESVLRKLHVYDNFDPSKHSENTDETQFKDMEKQLSDINRILQMVE